MKSRLDVYQCGICGNIVELMHAGPGKLTCCNSAMEPMVENTVDAAKEKHVPVFEKNGSTLTVKVGDVAHPMDVKHYIEWIEVVSGDQVYTRYLNPGDTPEAVFTIDSDEFTVRAYCNLHGLWKA